MTRAKSVAAPTPRRRKLSQPALTGNVRGADEASLPWEIVVDEHPQRRSTRSEPTAGPIIEDLPMAEQLETIERRIASHLQKIRRSFRVAINERIKIGKCLMEAKGLCGHGEWLDFLKSCGLHQRTAQECMQFAEYEELISQKTHGRAPLTIETVRKMITAERKAIGQSRAAQSTSRSRTSEEVTLDPGTPRAPDRPSDTATESAATEPATPAAESSDEGQSALASTSATPGPTTPASSSDAGIVIASATDVNELSTNPSGAGTGEGQQDAPGADDLPEEVWLSTIPLRGRLGNTSHFDVNALFWRRAQPLFAQLRDLIKPSLQEIGHSARFKLVFNRIPLRLLHGTCIKPPYEWLICSKCAGRCTDLTGKQSCGWCDGGGYLITHEADSQGPDFATP
jgi:hypothetical protein